MQTLFAKACWEVDERPLDWFVRETADPWQSNHWMREELIRRWS
jgi:hypothetical protein